ncbi:reverse transcriptase domain-containing protein [Tanacetum coccineum]
MRKDSRIPIILGRPFLATARAMIDVFNKKITLRIGSEEVIFDVDQSMKKPRMEDDECYGIDDLDTVIQSAAQELLENENLEDSINRPDFESRVPNSEIPIRRIDHINTPYSQETQEQEETLSEHLYSARFFQIPIALEDQEKTTFTCPYGTFAYRRMPFGLCNAPATFQRCMMAIFHEMVEDFMEVFMDDFSVFGNSFDQCLNNLDKMLGRCEETNLVLSWEKCHFMVKEGIVLGHKISGKGIEVDKSKINYLFSKQAAKPRLIRWVLLLQGFNIEIKYKKRAENLAADHLSRLENLNTRELAKDEIEDKFPDERLMILKAKLNVEEPWYADFVNYIFGKVVPLKWTPEKKKRFFS